MSSSRKIWHLYGFAAVTSVLVLAAVLLHSGFGGMLTVLTLAGLEITFSFENAVVNARILQGMSRFWQQIFITLGVLIAVFVVRVFLPLFIVVATSTLSFRDVISLALNNPVAYSEHLRQAQPIIAAFGSVFLLMVFWDFILQEREIRWVRIVENALQRVGRLKNISVILTITTLLLVTYVFVPGAEQQKVITGGMVGLLLYLCVNALSYAVDPRDATLKRYRLFRKIPLHPGFIGFLYLEMIDASFSLDGVIGAFAITQDIFFIAAGLGIGALFVRSLTVHMLRRGVLAQYRFIDHGAHYAIASLSVLMLVSIWRPVPEYVTSLSGIIIILVAIFDSRLYEHKARAGRY